VHVAYVIPVDAIGLLFSVFRQKQCSVLRSLVSGTDKMYFKKYLNTQNCKSKNCKYCKNWILRKYLNTFIRYFFSPIWYLNTLQHCVCVCVCVSINSLVTLTFDLLPLKLDSHQSYKPWMALNSLFADMPLRNYPLTHFPWNWYASRIKDGEPSFQIWGR